MKLHPDVTDPRARKRAQTLEADFRKVHGDKYDYSNFIYMSARTKSTVLCSKHEPFQINPNNHLNGQGCPLCGKERQLEENSNRLKLAKSKFSKKANSVHNGKYDYSEAKYLGGHTKLTIICPEHGKFRQTPSSHLRGTGCPKCAGNQSQGSDYFIEKAKIFHGNRYDYSKVIYQNSGTKVEIICKIHGSFHQVPDSHYNGNGCPKCGGNYRKNTDDFIKSAITTHGDYYDYSKVKYLSSHKKVVIVCDKHGGFRQTPDSHLRGSGCPSCQESGFQPQQEAILYYLSIHNGKAYKIGITNRTVEDRFGTDMQYIRIVKIWRYSRGIDAQKREREIKKLFQNAKWNGGDLLKDGNTELFEYDVLQLDSDFE